MTETESPETGANRAQGASASFESREAWLERMEALSEESGYFEPLGRHHWASFSDEGPVLLVTFETLDAIRQRPDQMPLGHRIAQPKGWSSLCLITDGWTWYRHPAVYAFFDRQVDDAFFEDFDQVVFYGAGMGGYAAAAFSVTAPGATVLLCAPQATLDPRVSGWDPRFRPLRRLSFTDRYGYAPEMTEGAGPVHVIYDPDETLDAMHAALFTRPYVTKLPCPNLGPDPADALQAMGILAPLIEAACEGRMDPALFWQLYRARRRYGGYLRNLMTRLDEADRPFLNALLCRNVVQRQGAPRFRRRLEQLHKQLEAEGRSLPPVGGQP